MFFADQMFWIKKKANSTEGEVIHIEKVSRLHMGAYLCIAQNGKLIRFIHCNHTDIWQTFQIERIRYSSIGI